MRRWDMNECGRRDFTTTERATGAEVRQGKAARAAAVTLACDGELGKVGPAREKRIVVGDAEEER